jgi:hypothetical protein
MENKLIKQEMLIEKLEQQITDLKRESEIDQRNAAMSQRESANLLDENRKLRIELSVK